MKNFWSNNPLPNYCAKMLRENGIGYMRDRRGNRLPSVSAIIQATKPPAEKARLALWREEVGQAEANRIIAAATQRGKLGRQQIERYFRGENAPCPEPIRPHWECLLPVLEKINNVRLFEGNVFHFYQGYAGRVNCVANYDYLPCVIQFKFADRIKPLYSEPLQLAAYCGALNRQYGEPYGIRLNHALSIAIAPDGTDIDFFSPEDVRQYWQQWQERVALFWEL